MTPEEKAKELVEMFYKLKDDSGSFISHTRDEAKQCALICVDEIIQLIGVMKQGNLIISYWLDVKQEITKL